MLLPVTLVLACFLPLGSSKPRAAIATPSPEGVTKGEEGGTPGPGNETGATPANGQDAVGGTPSPGNETGATKGWFAGVIAAQGEKRDQQGPDVEAGNETAGHDDIVIANGTNITVEGVTPGAGEGGTPAPEGGGNATEGAGGTPPPGGEGGTPAPEAGGNATEGPGGAPPPPEVQNGTVPGGGTPFPDIGQRPSDVRDSDLICVCTPSPGGPFTCKCSPPSSGKGPSLPVENASPGSEIVTTPTPGASPGPPAAGHGNKTYVVCVKPGNKTTPVSDYLTTGKGKSVKVQGQWLYYHCKFGVVEPFLINQTVYEDLNKQCKDKGYQFAQPSDDQHTASYPFEYEGIIGEYYRHRTPFSFNRQPNTPSDRCKEERKRRRRRH